MRMGQKGSQSGDRVGIRGPGGRELLQQSTEGVNCGWEVGGSELRAPELELSAFVVPGVEGSGLWPQSGVGFCVLL